MELCQILRRESDVAIIILTAKAGLADRIFLARALLWKS